MSNQYIFEPPTTGKVLLHTTAGEIEVELWTKEAPLTCKNFIQLCLEGYYEGTTFHRLVKDFIIQGGDPTGTGKGGDSIYGKAFKDEFHQRLRFNRRALLGMANAGTKDSNSSQFFFTLGSEPARELDKKHTLFGKVTGPTVFNMLRMAESEVDEKERPTPMYKITKAQVLLNPFDDIKPREKEKKKKVKEEKKIKVVETKKLNLLSFGDEAEEDDAQIDTIHKALKKPKSAHDVLEDKKLSAEVAVRRDEMADYDPNEERSDDAGTLDRIRERLKKRKIGGEEGGSSEKKREVEGDDDLEDMIDRERREKEREEVERKAAEVKAVQKEYMKALRKPKEKKPEPIPEATDNMKKYESMKMKFKDPSKNIVKTKDPQREAQSDSIMERFRLKLSKTDQESILFDKKIDLGEAKKKEKEKEEEKEAEEGKYEEEEGDKTKFGVDLDAEDEGQDWYTSKFVAQDEVDPNVTRAKDANMKDTSEDWYEITDPRNAINRRRRGEKVE